MATGAELTYNTSATALQMANEIFGNGVTVVGASYTGAPASKAIYGNGDALSPFATPGNSGVILSTGNAASFTQSSGDPNRSASTTAVTSGPNNVAGFNALVGTNTYDASYMDVDFIPTGTEMTLQFVFSSDEYPEYTGSIYNDAVGVWVNGAPVNLAIGSGQTTVNNLNPNTNLNLYVSNTGDQYNSEMDGFTLTLTLKMQVIAGVVNSIRIGIADVSDAKYDSNLLIAGNSAQTVLVAHSDAVTMGVSGTRNVDVLGNDVSSTGSILTVTHINGVAVVAGQQVTLPTGQMVTLNADGTFTILGDGQTETVTFNYTIRDTLGNTDTAYVTVSQVPCFVAGTMILTPDGDVAVESLRPGDLVVTHDEGPQPLRWIGRRVVEAVGDFAPICIEADTFGCHDRLMVSPLHRILIRDSLAELLFGEAEVLVAARDLVNDDTVRQIEGSFVEYVHLLFNRHQVVCSAGLLTESFLPGPQIAASFEQDMVAEITAIFPEISRDGAKYPEAARRTLRRHEAQVLMATGLAA